MRMERSRFGSILLLMMAFAGCGGGAAGNNGGDAGQDVRTDVKKDTNVGGPTCTDRLLNGNETGVDCGGSCPACPVGSNCTVAADCQTQMCAGGKCVGGNCTN